MGGFAYFALDDDGEVSQTPVKLTSRGRTISHGARTRPHSRPFPHVNHRPIEIQQPRKDVVVLSGGVVLPKLCFSPRRAPAFEPFGGDYAGAWSLHSSIVCSVVVKAPEYRRANVDFDGRRTRSRCVVASALISQNNWLGLSLSAVENTAIDSTSVLARKAARRYQLSDGDLRELYVEPGDPLNFDTSPRVQESL